MVHDDTLIYLTARQWPRPDRHRALLELSTEDARWVRRIWTRLDRRGRTAWKDQHSVLLAEVLTQVREWDGQF